MERFARWLAILVFALGTLTAAPSLAADIVIGSGDPESIHHQTARALCRLVNRRVEGVRCSVRPTSGSEFNLENVRGGALDLGLALSDTVHHAVNRSGAFRFQDTDFATLRSLFSLQAEPLVVVVGPGARVATVADLRGLRVNVGSPGSRQSALMGLALEAAGLDRADFALIEELPRSQQWLALCHGRIDAAAFVGAHPDSELERVVQLCDASVAGLPPAMAETIIAGRPELLGLELPAHAYAGQYRPVPSIGARLTVVASRDLDEGIAYAIVKAVFVDLDTLRTMHPTLRDLSAETMRRRGLAAPLHEGARRFYAERGLM